jgi:hypothetical protein
LPDNKENSRRALGREGESGNAGDESVVQFSREEGFFMEQEVTLRALPKAHGAHDMILPALRRVVEVLEAEGRREQVDLFFKLAEACLYREELVRLAREYVKAK